MCGIVRDMERLIVGTALCIFIGNNMNKSLLFLSLLFGFSTAQLLPNAAMPAAKFAKALAASKAVDAKQVAAKKKAEAQAQQAGSLDDEELHIDTATAISAQDMQYFVEGPMGKQIAVPAVFAKKSGLFKEFAEVCRKNGVSKCVVPVADAQMLEDFRRHLPLFERMIVLHDEAKAKGKKYYKDIVDHIVAGLGPCPKAELQKFFVGGEYDFTWHRSVPWKRMERYVRQMNVACIFMLPHLLRQAGVALLHESYDAVKKDPISLVEKMRFRDLPFSEALADDFRRYGNRHYFVCGAPLITASYLLRLQPWGNKINWLHRNLRSLSGIADLPNKEQVTELCLRDNYLHGLDADVVRSLPKLEELDLICNPIVALPDSTIDALAQHARMRPNFRLQMTDYYPCQPSYTRAVRAEVEKAIPGMDSEPLDIIRHYIQTLLLEPETTEKLQQQLGLNLSVESFERTDFCHTARSWSYKHE
jgi:hypothetical protein